MGFHQSSMDIKLKDCHLLTAYCQRPSGEAIYSEIDLNEFVGTKKGKLAWSAGNFSQVAENINLQLEGETHEPILHASLRDDSGDLHESCVNLAECIKNEDGHLRFMDCF